MTTPLHSTLKRALTIDGREYVITLTESASLGAFAGKSKETSTQGPRSQAPPRKPKARKAPKRPSSKRTFQRRS